MKIRILLSVFLLVSLTVAEAQSNEVKQVVFTSLTRGYQKQILITPDSVKLNISGREVQSFHRKLRSGEWNTLLHCVRKTGMNTLPQLESPTMKRAHDGALHSSITIITDQEWTHSFDDENPNEKLVPLMKLIKKIGEK
jgi:hypothetical protein